MEHYPNSFRGFIGNEIEINKLQAYLNDFLQGNVVNESQILIQGKSGTGKTFLTKILAEYYEIPILRITPEDIKTHSDLSHLKQIINSIPINTTSKYKLIIIEDLQDYDKKTKIQFNIMNSIPKLSNNPIIYTFNGDLYPLQKSFKDSSLIIKLTKPNTNQTYLYLEHVAKERKIKISEDTILEIAKKAPSVCSAVNSLYSCFVNKSYSSKLSIWDKFYGVKARTLKEDIDYNSLNIIALNTDDPSTLLYLSNLSHKAEYFNFKKDIDKHLLNNINIKLNKRIATMKTTIFKNHSTRIKEIAKELHVSANTLFQEYKFLLDKEDKPRRKKATVKTIKQKQKPKPISSSLSKFF